MTNKTSTPTIVGATLDVSGITDFTVILFTWVVVAGLCQTIDVVGFVTNAINIVCFTKQGFKESVNISLCGLAISDLGCIATQMLLNIFYTFESSSADLTFEPLDVAYLAAAMPHLAFNRVNIWITVIITMERCLCITVPLKMKQIVTPKRVWILISGVYVVFLFSGVPVFVVNRLGLKVSSTNNKTILGLVFTPDKDTVEKITFTINSFLLPFIAFFIISICTAILVVNLRKRTQWLKISSNNAQAGISNRDQKVAQMVLMISILFLICFIPLAVTMLALAFEPRLSIGGPLLNIGKLLGHIVLLMESVNSSSNIFIYYRMSKKYRDTFRAIFWRDIHKP